MSAHDDTRATPGRRRFMKTAGIAAAAAAGTAVLATPNVSRAQTTVFRFQSTWPQRDIFHEFAQDYAKKVNDMSAGRLRLDVLAAGAVVGAFQLIDGVSAGALDGGHGVAGYWYGKNKAASLFGTTAPFGWTANELLGWIHYGGGQALYDRLLKDILRVNVVSHFYGPMPSQPFGWFRREIRSLKDMQGLRFRIPGLAGEMLSRIGVLPQVIAPADIYSSLERGTIDATEFVGPYDDEKLGFAKVTKFYYYPGFWEGGAQLSMYVGLKEWEKLPREFQQAIDVASAEINVNMLAEYDAKNPPALARIQKTGVQVRPFPVDVMVAAQKAAFQIYDEEAAKNPSFAKIYANWRAFRDAQHAWHRTADLSFDSFVLNNPLGAPAASNAPAAPAKK